MIQALAALAASARAKVFAAAADSFDVLITACPEHVGYVSGYRSMAFDSERDYQTAAVATPDRLCLVVGSGDAPAALEVVGETAELFRYGWFFVAGAERSANDHAAPAPAFQQAVAAALAAVAQPGDTIGIDAALHAAELRSVIGSRPTLDARKALLTARITKLPGEIERIERAAILLDRSAEAAFAHARAGMSEHDVAAVITAEIVRGGGVPRFVVVTAGERSALVDAYASTRRLTEGDILRLDLGCSVEGHWADMARTAIVGEPTATQRRRYAALLEGQQAAMDAIRPGVASAEVFGAAVARVRAAGLPEYWRHHCGHGLGLTCHERPVLGPDDSTRLEAGMVLCVETPFYEIGWGGMMVEDIVVVTSEGHRRLTRSDRALHVIGQPRSLQPTLSGDAA